MNDKKLRPTLTSDELQLITDALNSELRSLLANPSAMRQATKVIKLVGYLNEFAAKQAVGAKANMLMAAQAGSEYKQVSIAAVNAYQNELDTGVSILDNPELTDAQKHAFISAKAAHELTEAETKFALDYGFKDFMNKASKTNVDEGDL